MLGLSKFNVLREGWDSTLSLYGIEETFFKLEKVRLPGVGVTPEFERPATSTYSTLPKFLRACREGCCARGLNAESGPTFKTIAVRVLL